MLAAVLDLTVSPIPRPRPGSREKRKVYESAASWPATGPTKLHALEKRQDVLARPQTAAAWLTQLNRIGRERERERERDRERERVRERESE